MLLVINDYCLTESFFASIEESNLPFSSSDLFLMESILAFAVESTFSNKVFFLCSRESTLLSAFLASLLHAVKDPEN